MNLVVVVLFGVVIGVGGGVFCDVVVNRDL